MIIYMSQTPNLMSCLALSTISPLFVDRFRRSLRFFHLEFDTEPFLRVKGVKMAGIDLRLEVLIMHGNVFRLFGAKISPLLIRLMSCI